MASILQRIHKSTLRFLIPLTPEQTYVTIVNEAIKLVGGQHGSILLGENGELKRVYSSYPALYNVGSKTKDIRYRVFKTRKPVILSTKQLAYYSKKYPELKAIKDRAAIILALSYKNESLGILSVISLKNADFKESELEALKLFGALASLAIKKTQLYSETKEALEIRDLFIAMAAHELRTPLTVVSGYAQLLSQKFLGTSRVEGRWVAELSAEAKRLTRLVNSLLDVNSIKTGALRYTWRECSVKEIIKTAHSEFKFTHPEHKIVFKDKIGNNPDTVVADSDKILQVVSNILDNAAKFSLSDRKIEVEVGLVKRDITISVRDKGLGVSPEDIERVFEGFYKGKGNLREGLGLGLFLAKHILSRHKGEIVLLPRYEGGTEVKITLPASFGQSKKSQNLPIKL